MKYTIAEGFASDAQLRKENAELKAENADLQKKLDFFMTETVAGKEYRPKSEVDELKVRNGELAGQVASLNRWLGEAKEIIRRLINSCCSKGATGKATEEAENFLKEK